MVTSPLFPVVSVTAISFVVPLIVRVLGVPDEGVNVITAALVPEVTGIVYVVSVGAEPCEMAVM